MNKLLDSISINSYFPLDYTLNEKLDGQLWCGLGTASLLTRYYREFSLNYIQGGEGEILRAWRGSAWPSLRVKSDGAGFIYQENKQRQERTQRREEESRVRRINI